jgi:hypothetical protein
VTLAKRYVELALRLQRHWDELVFGYSGPRELAERVAAEETVEPARLAADAEAILAELAGSDENRRTRWLAAQTAALLTLARRLDGHELPYREDVERSYGVEPEWYPEDEFERVHRELDEALRGSGELRERYSRWLEATALPKEILSEALSATLAEFRDRTRALFGLPEGEEVELRLVGGKRWGGYSEFFGGLRSILHVNTDLPLPSGDLAHFVAHESYPGHHTENAWKEALLVRDQGRLEATIMLATGPEGVIAEGLAQLARDALLGAEAESVTAELLASLGFDYEPNVGARVRSARMLTNDVAANLALMRHERGAGEEELAAYARRWTLQPEERIEKLVAWVCTQPFRGYVVTYSAGLRLAKAFVGTDSDRFKRLLTEQLVPADLRVSSAAA